MNNYPLPLHHYHLPHYRRHHQHPLHLVQYNCSPSFIPINISICRPFSLAFYSISTRWASSCRPRINFVIASVQKPIAINYCSPDGKVSPSVKQYPVRSDWKITAPSISALYFIDAAAVLNHVRKAFHASRSTSRNSTRSMCAFAITLTTILKEHAKGEPVVAVFDLNVSPIPSSQPSNANLTAMRICRALGLCVIHHEDVRPYDVIATLVATARRSGVRSVIVSVSAASVLHQLLDDEWVTALTLHRAGSFETISESSLHDMYDVNSLNARQIVDIVALSGDLANNVPGVSGFGKRTAAKLIRRFITLGSLLKVAHIVMIDSASHVAIDAQRRFDGASLTKRLASRLLENEKSLLQMKKNLTAKEDVVLPDVTWSSLQRVPVNADELSNIVSNFNLSDDSMLERLLHSGDDVSPCAGGPYVPLAGASPVYASEDARAAIVDDVANPSVYHIEAFAQSVHDCVALLPLFDESGGAQSLRAFSICGVSGGTVLMNISGKDVFPEPVVRILTDSTIEKRGWFLKQFHKYLSSECNINLNGVLFDNHIASRLLHAGAELNDEAIAARYLDTGNTLGKWLRNVDGGRLTSNISEEWCLPLCRDAFTLATALRRAIFDNDLATIMFDVEAPLIPVLADMETTGVPIDSRRLQVLHDKLRKRRIALRTSLQSILSPSHLRRDEGRRLRLSSQQDISNFLFPLSNPNSPQQPHQRRRYQRINEVTLSRLASDDKANKKHRRFARLLIRYRKVSQLMRRNTSSLLGSIHIDSRVRPTFVQNAAASGRLSTSKPNLQSLPLRSLIGGTLRRTVKARDGWCIMSADYSQIELRIVASMSKDGNLVAAFSQDVDVHELIAREMFGEASVAKVTDEQRTMAKQVVYSIIYGISSKGLSERLRIARRDADLLISQFFKRFPDVQRLTKRLVDEAVAREVATTLLGRRQRLGHLVNGTKQQQRSAKRVAMNMPIQGTQADMLKLAMSGIWGRLQETNLQSRIIMQMHDELILEAEELERDQVVQLVLEEMVRASPMSDVDALVKIGCGKTWLEASNSAVIHNLRPR